MSTTTSSTTTTTTTTTTIDYDLVTVWPNITEPEYPIKESTYLPSHHIEKEGPYVQVRKKWTAGKKEWTLEWTEKVPLPESDYQIIEAFFLAKQGSAFTWIHYSTGISYTVMFDQDELEDNIIVPGYRTLTIKLQEI